MDVGPRSVRIDTTTTASSLNPKEARAFLIAEYSWFLTAIMGCVLVTVTREIGVLFVMAPIAGVIGIVRNGLIFRNRRKSEEASSSVAADLFPFNVKRYWEESARALGKNDRVLLRSRVVCLAAFYVVGVAMVIRLSID